MDTSNSKAAIVDKIKKSTTILVTVSHDPSVDALAAALSFSLMLNKIDKSATAVFSGTVPPAITFLQPEKNFEGTVDSLRDFIIALDKAKADRLRYKVEGDVVRIYITPYKTDLSERDLEFSQGDFNVDLVIALGVEKQSDLDNAISAHGRILHDATVATINNRDIKSSLGSIDWSDSKASSLCEMLMSLSEALGDKLLDEQIATGLLTGIVAATNRFSNEHTTPRVMTMSAQLMAAGANQQLIAEKLQAGGVSFDTINVREQAESQTTPQPEEVPEQQEHVDGVMHVSHEPEPELESELPPVQAERDDAQQDFEPVGDDRLEQALGHKQPMEILKQKIDYAKENEADRPHSTDWRDHVHDPYPDPDDEDGQPLMGGTLNATASEAEASKRAEERESRNHTILSHDAPAANPSPSAPQAYEEPKDVDPFAEDERQQQQRTDNQPSSRGKTIQPVTMQPIKSPPVTPPLPVLTPSPSAFSMSDSGPTNDLGMSYEESPLPNTPATHDQTLADLEAEVHAAAAAHPATSSLDDARAAVTNAFDQSLSVGGQPAHVPATPQQQGGIPPMPDFSTLPPLPPMPDQQAPTTPHPAVMPPTFPMTQPDDGQIAPPAPGQFRIPGR